MDWPWRWPPATWQVAFGGLLLLGIVAGLDAVLGERSPVPLIVLATGVWPAGVSLYDQLVTREKQVTVGMTVTVLAIGTLLPLLVLGLLFIASIGTAI